MSLASTQDAVQRDGPISVRAQDSAPRGFARVTVDVLPLLADRELKVLLALELLARGNEVFRASNDDIVWCTGKSETAVEETLRALEQGGHIERVYYDRERHHRLGIRLLTRSFNPTVFRARTLRVVDPGNPGSDPWESEVGGSRISGTLSLDVLEIDSKTFNVTHATAPDSPAPAEVSVELATPSAEACQLYQELTERGIRFELQGEKVQMWQHAPDSPPPTAEERERLGRLKPELVALIAQSERRPVSSAGAAPVRRAGAPPFRNPHRIRVLMGLLGPGAGEASCRELAEALVAECRDSDVELSRRTYLGIARDVCRGRISQADLQTSFEIASGPGIHHRGRALIAEVRRRRHRILQ